MRMFLVLSFAAICLEPNIAVAQRVYARETYRFYPPVARAATARESFSYGRAAEIWASGKYNLLTSKAWINAQEAYTKYLENRRLATRTYFENRALNRMYRRQERGPHPTRAQIERMAKAGVPQRPTPEQLDPGKGNITWPRVLSKPGFSLDSQRIEAFFRQRSHPNRQPSTAEYHNAISAIGQMRLALRRQIYDLDPAEYIAARKFLDALAYEMRFPIEPADKAPTSRQAPNSSLPLPWTSPDNRPLRLTL